MTKTRVGLLTDEEHVFYDISTFTASRFVAGVTGVHRRITGKKPRATNPTTQSKSPPSPRESRRDQTPPSNTPNP
ncbi:hypothetical protein F2Q68_00043061 [Brassica cretica]|uniref:Uncharacterized protein n=1 Tax=Brassica cretica TaxID=69181 RepID=A0A8S9LII1_BRACR|nr:hypothetical protein F2Q68_00043061 [Brassica cretica]